MIPEGDAHSRQDRFEALVNAYSSDLYRFGVWLCRDRSVAEDLVQETFARAWRSLDQLEEYHAAKSWLFTILRREFARLCRQRKGAPVSIETVDPGLLHEPFSGAARSTEIFALRRALATLAADYREPLVMQVIGGFSCAEIARIMETTEGAINTRLSRARQQLRAQLDGNDVPLQERKE